MAAAGVIAQVEIAAAEAELERRRDTHYASLGLVTEVENVLKALLAPSREAALWNDEIIPADVGTLAPPQAGDLREAVSKAIRQRPELRSVESRQEANQIQKQLSAEQTKPQVNLVAGYGNAGLGGSVSAKENPFAAASMASTVRLNELSVRAGLPPLTAVSFGGPMPEFLVGGYGAALGNVFTGRYQTFQVGLSMDLTLRNRMAESALAQNVLTERRLALERTRLEQAIEAQVRNALQALDTARQRIVAAEASARAAKEKLDSEIRLFQSGESTNFLVLTRQNEYADSRRRELVAHLDFNKAVARLRQALGATLVAHKIRVQ
jgi:HAE1 family hydrophobic/amphiphilic exporter-1